MSDSGGRTLEEQREHLRERLRAQRQDLAHQLLAPHARSTFPRSTTMRFLLRQPELVGWLVSRIAGAGIGVPVTGVLMALGHLDIKKAPAVPGRL